MQLSITQAKATSHLINPRDKRQNDRRPAEPRLAEQLLRSWRPEPSGLTREETQKIVLDMIG